jgi:peptidyl-prolyl cis-trans isomerase SurA
VQANQVDPEVAHIIAEMPVGAVSNPIKVAGGFSIVTLHAKREIGRDEGTVLKLRQAFLPFTTPLNPAEPTDAQRAALDRTRQLSASAHGCDAIEEANKAWGSGHPADPGEVRLEQMNNPQLRALLSGLPDNKASQPLVGNDGITIVMVCGREQKNFGLASKQEISARILNDRVELASRQLQRDLRRRAMIDQKTQVAG